MEQYSAELTGSEQRISPLIPSQLEQMVPFQSFGQQEKMKVRDESYLESESSAPMNHNPKHHKNLAQGDQAEQGILDKYLDPAENIIKG